MCFSISSPPIRIWGLYTCPRSILLMGFIGFGYEQAMFPNLVFCFQVLTVKIILVVPPLALPMVCNEPPKILTAATDTVAALTNNQLSTGTTFGGPLRGPCSPHCHGACCIHDPCPILRPEYLPRGEHQKGTAHYRTHIALWVVYVDDFLVLVQGGSHTRCRVKCALLYTLETVLGALDNDNSIHHQEPASTKEMVKGESA
jgi:hypothetical protein